jgi:putative tryptophan/tyrosine transport system substrate-binding protein
MRRRDFIGLLACGALAWPLTAYGQRSERVRRIAVMMSNAENDPDGRARAGGLRDGLRELGWVDGQNLQIEWRWSGGEIGRIRDYAAELVELAPELIVANGTANLSVIKQVARSIPIVFVVVNDPVGQGFIASLAHPGGNITGFTFVEYSMFGKSLDLLRQLTPAAHVAFLFNPDTSPYYDGFLPSFQKEAQASSIEVAKKHVRSEAEIEAVLRELAAKPGGALIVPSDTYTLANRALIVKFAAQYRIPAIYAYRQSVKEGGLISYGPETADIFRRSASYIDRILKGAKPAELPAQAPAKFELAVNLTTASALGVVVPPTLLALADEVVE